MTLDDLNIVEAEIARFLSRLKNARKRIKEDEFALICGSKETGAVKRSALDLKMELTRITK